jgi:hypothetical protein
VKAPFIVRLEAELNVAVFPPPDSKIKGPVVMEPPLGDVVTVQLPAPGRKVIVRDALKVMVLPVDSKVTAPPGLTPLGEKFMVADALLVRAPVIDLNRQESGEE